MWESLPLNEKQEYQKMILAFASLSEMFSQKSEDEASIAPIINSKYQETVFQKVFDAVVEDIGNTSFDASLNVEETGQKYLIGIKTFGYKSGCQKVAQFKKDSVMFADLYNQIVENAQNSDGSWKDKKDIDKANHDLYMQIAVKISNMRNTRMKSSKENLKGFGVDADDDRIESVYHVLMPSKAGEEPMVYVGEISYDEIDVGNIEIDGCTTKNSPKNFNFNDGNHHYRYTEADNQLLMDFQNRSIVKEKWNVVYAENAYDIFSNIADDVNKKEIKSKITEEHIFPLINSKGKVEMFSGLNEFNGSPKSPISQRKKDISKLKNKYADIIDTDPFKQCIDIAEDALLDPNGNHYNAEAKAEKRQASMQLADSSGNKDFASDIKKLLHRPAYEVYIPIPHAKEFHKKYPDFFAKDAGKLKPGTNQLALSRDERSFNLIFEPSGQMIPSFIDQDTGKAIESCEKQTYLGKWILRGVFQLDEYEPLTREKMEDVEINAMKLYRTTDDDDVHLEFIWQDEEDLPQD